MKKMARKDIPERGPNEVRKNKILMENSESNLFEFQTRPVYLYSHGGLL